MTMTTAKTSILLVDDIEENLIALTALLRSEGVQLHTARSGREALELLLTNEYALALLDVQMPEIDGFELAEIMRGNPRTRMVPIIFLTANPHEPQRLFKGYEAGAVDFLFKPIEPRILLRKVSTFLELYEQKRQLRLQLADLERMTGELKESLRLSETFVAALGHDLRNPLTAVSCGLALLEERTDDQVFHRTIKRMRSSTARMAALIDQLYDVARVRLGGGMTLEMVAMDMIEVVREVVREQGAVRPELELSVDAEGDGHGIWDAARLSRAVGNLVGNAIQHGEPGAAIHVRIDGSQAAMVRVEVRNQGLIPQSVRAHLFEPFRRGSDSGVKGLGLGLYIVQQVAEAHGGRVTFTSAPQVGTCFILEVPRRLP